MEQKIVKETWKERIQNEVIAPLGMLFIIAVLGLLAYGAYWIIKAIIGFIKYYAKFA